MKREENSGRHEVKRERAPQHHRARFSVHAFVYDVKLFVKKTLALNNGFLVCTSDGFVLQVSFFREQQMVNVKRRQKVGKGKDFIIQNI